MIGMASVSRIHSVFSRLSLDEGDYPVCDAMRVLPDFES